MTTTRSFAWCESCLAHGTRIRATTRSVNPEWSGYALCAICAAEYDSRPPTETSADDDEAAYYVWIGMQS